MTKIQLEKKILELELENKRIVTELIDVDKLMRDIGFLDGLKSLKITAEKVNKKPKS